MKERNPSWGIESSHTVQGEEACLAQDGPTDDKNSAQNSFLSKRPLALRQAHVPAHRHMMYCIPWSSIKGLGLGAVRGFTAHSSIVGHRNSQEYEGSAVQTLDLAAEKT